MPLKELPGDYLKQQYLLCKSKVNSSESGSKWKMWTENYEIARNLKFTALFFLENSSIPFIFVVGECYKSKKTLWESVCA